MAAASSAALMGMLRGCATLGSIVGPAVGSGGEGAAASGSDRDEQPVALARDRLDEAGLVRIVAECLAQLRMQRLMTPSTTTTLGQTLSSNCSLVTSFFRLRREHDEDVHRLAFDAQIGRLARDAVQARFDEPRPEAKSVRGFATAVRCWHGRRHSLLFFGDR